VATQFTQGDYSQRMKVESVDEMASLANSYNEMAQSIEQQITRLEHLSRVQQRFVSDVTHELRTPLTTLRMASEVIHNQRDSFDPVVARSSELLVAQLDRFERLLEDLMLRLPFWNLSNLMSSPSSSGAQRISISLAISQHLKLKLNPNMIL
jgi:two-component system sensor histidine kinase MtrB